MIKELKINKEEFNIFLEVAKELNKKGVIPVLFGSLGLMRIIGEFKKAGDIDVLVEKELIGKKWLDFIKTMKSLDFRLQNEKEHEFLRNNKIIAFADVNDLLKFDINCDHLKVSEEKGVKFKELSVHDYLVCYQKMLRDQYRQEKRGKDDQEKIKLIKEFIREDCLENQDLRG